MLSNHENRERMRCKLIENLKFDSHFEASRLRDYSGYSPANYSNISSSTVTAATATAGTATTVDGSKSPSIESAQNLAQKLSINKEAINEQIKEDVVGEEEFSAATSGTSSSPQAAISESGSEATQQVVARNEIRSSSSTANASDSGLSRTSSLLSVNKTPQPVIAPVEPYEQFAQLEEKEKLLLKSDCELITVTRVVKGKKIII